MVLAQLFFHGVEPTDLADEPRGGTAFAQGVVKPPTRMRPAANQDQLFTAFAGQRFIDAVTIGLELATKTFEERARPSRERLTFQSKTTSPCGWL